jgi:hypothetical protein
LPRYFNDGQSVPPELFVQSHEERTEYFGGVTIDTMEVVSYWKHAGRLYQDLMRRLTIAGEDDAETDEFIRQSKERLKERFGQEDIWITAQRIDVI